MKWTTCGASRRVLVTAQALTTMVLVSAANGQVGRTLFNVKDFGAQGNGSANDLPAIAAAIQLAVTSPAARMGKGAVIFFPEGTYRVTSTIEVPAAGIFNVAGLDFVGASPTQGPSAQIPGSIIVADFNDGAAVPLIHWKMSGARLTDLVLAGRLNGNSVFPSALIQTSAGAGCMANVAFDHVTFGVFPEIWTSGVPRQGLGISIGSTSTECNNSEFMFNNCTFVSMSTCVRVNTEQGLNYNFEMCGGVNCTTFLDLVQGGNVSFNIGGFSGCGGAGEEDWIFKIGYGGPGSGAVKIANSRFEPNVDGTFCRRLVRVDGRHAVLLENLTQWDDQCPVSNPAIEVGSGSVVASNCRFFSWPVLNFRPPVFSWTDGAVRFRDCSFPMFTPIDPCLASVPTWPTTQPPPAGMVTGPNPRYSIQNCTGIYNGKAFYPIRNFTNVPGW